MASRTRRAPVSSETRLAREELINLAHDVGTKLTALKASTQFLQARLGPTFRARGSLENILEWFKEVELSSEHYVKRREGFRDGILAINERVEKISSDIESGPKLEEKAELERERRELLTRWRGVAADYLSKLDSHIRMIEPDFAHVARINDLPEANESARKVFVNSLSGLKNLIEGKRGPVEEVDLVKFAREYSSLLSRRANEGPKVSFNFPPFELPFTTVWVRPSEMRRAMERLLNNAVEAGATKIRVSARPTITGKVMIKIRNNGEPIPPEIAEKIYIGHTTKKNGTGLGVPGAKRIIESHGGTLSHVSHKPFLGLFKPKYSTSFKIVLPRNRREPK